MMKHYTETDDNIPVNPGVAAAIFRARTSLSMLGSSLIGRRWTLKMDALPLMSGGPERRQETFIHQKKRSESSTDFYF